MAFVLSSFLGGMAKGATDYIDEQQKLNADSMSLSVKSMVKDYADYQKTTKEQKDMMKQTVRELSGISFSDGILSDEQLIAMAAKPEQAKIILEKIKNDPEVTGRISKNFITALEGTPTGVKPEEYINSLFKTAKATDEQVQAAFGPKQTGSFLDRLAGKNSLTQAQKEAAQYGVSLEDLLGARSGAARAVTASAKVDLSVLAKEKTFSDMEDKAKINLYQAQRPDPKTGAAPSEEQVKIATENLAQITAINAKPKDAETVLIDKIQDPKTPPEERDKLTAKLLERQKLSNGKHISSEAEIRTGLVNQIQDPTTTPAKRKALQIELDQRKALLDPKKDNANQEKITQANYITIASRALSSTVEAALPAGSMTTTVNLDGTVSMQPSSLVKGDAFDKAVVAAKSGVIKEFTTPDGKPKSELHKNGLISIGVTFDDMGKAVVPTAPVRAAFEVPAAPGARVGGSTLLPPRAAAAPTVDAAFVATERAKAKAAIANKKDPDAVKALFKSNTNQDY
jgi:hypothetical protein